MFSVGPPKPFVAAAPREHGTPPQQGFGNPTVIIPPSTVLTPLEVPIAEGLGAAAARVLAGIVAAPLELANKLSGLANTLLELGNSLYPNPGSFYPSPNRVPASPNKRLGVGLALLGLR